MSEPVNEGPAPSYVAGDLDLGPEQIKRFFDAQEVVLVCPICRSTDFLIEGVAEEPSISVGSPVLDMKSLTFNPSGVMFHVTVVCKNCTYVMSFSRNHMAKWLDDNSSR